MLYTEADPILKTGMADFSGWEPAFSGQPRVPKTVGEPSVRCARKERPSVDVRVLRG